MKPAWMWLTVGVSPFGMAFAQSSAETVEQRIRACTQLPMTERVGCLEKISRDAGTAPLPTQQAGTKTALDPTLLHVGASTMAAVGTSSPSPTSIAPAANSTTTTSPAMPPSDKWVVSETTSPVDYTPVAKAIASSNDAVWGLPMTLSIQCRGGRTAVAFASTSFKGRADDYSVSYSINEGPITGLGGTNGSFSIGLILKKDVVPLLQSLPPEGTIAFRVVAQSGPMLEGRYALGSLRKVVQRLAEPCRWPALLERK
jgi:hypothetical protein